MGFLIGLVGVALAGLVAFGVWRGRLVSIALAGTECPTCRVPLVPLRPPGDDDDSSQEGASRGWEVHACPRCEHVVTTVGSLPSPLAECPACRQRSLVVYAERAPIGKDAPAEARGGEVVVDEWCDLCGRRARTVLGQPRADPPAPAGRVLPFRRR